MKRPAAKIRQRVDELKVKKNVGCRGGTHLIPTSFRHLDEPTILAVWDDYRTRFYTQKDLAVKFGFTASLISKIVRAMPENVRTVDMAYLNRKVK